MFLKIYIHSNNILDDHFLPLLKSVIRKFIQKRQKLAHINSFEDALFLIRQAKNILVLTGAGVSVSCGIPDFRSPQGIYQQLAREFGLDDPQQMFDIDYFMETPELFYSFAKQLYPDNFQPSPSHYFIKLLESRSKLLRNYTQNIDTLENSTGISRVLNCHGSFATATCINCKYKCSGEAINSTPSSSDQKTSIDTNNLVDTFENTENNDPIKYKPLDSGFELPQENETSFKESSLPAKPFLDVNYSDDSEDDDFHEIPRVLKPDIVFFGEKLPEEFHSSLESDREKVDLLIVMGSSLKVAPVSEIMSHLPHTIPQIVINKTPITHLNFDIQLIGNSDDIISYICYRLGWNLKHPKIPGGSCLSDEYISTVQPPISKNSDSDNQSKSNNISQSTDLASDTTQLHRTLLNFGSPDENQDVSTKKNGFN
ncbi:hypothetical protein BB560_006339, partial [Smittium megazygosporum]